MIILDNNEYFEKFQFALKWFL